MSEEDFVATFEEMQSLFNRGLMKRQEFDQRIDELLQNPAMAVSVTHFTPVQKPTEALLAELDHLKRTGILSDEQYEERKSELKFQRGVQEGEAQTSPAAIAAPTNEHADVRKAKLQSYLDELLKAGILLYSEYETARLRIR
jgi:uncharacterized protein YqgQ